MRSSANKSLKAKALITANTAVLCYCQNPTSCLLTNLHVPDTQAHHHAQGNLGTKTHLKLPYNEYRYSGTYDVCDHVEGFVW